MLSMYECRQINGDSCSAESNEYCRKLDNEAAALEFYGVLLRWYEQARAIPLWFDMNIKIVSFDYRTRTPYYRISPLFVAGSVRCTEDDFAASIGPG